MMNLEFSIHDQKFHFSMTYDPNFTADRLTKAFAVQDGGCEPEVLHLMVRAIKPGDTVLDGGANIGFFTMVMSLLVGDKGKVMAFEPGPNNIDKLRENVALNKFTNVEIFQKALWNCTTNKKLYLAEDSGLNALVTYSEALSSTPVECTYIDDLGVGPAFIKLDIEGAELHALEGASILLEGESPFVVCEVNLGALGRFDRLLKTVREYMWEHGYNMFILHKDGALPTMVPERTVFTPSQKNRNVLFATPYMVGKAWPEVVV